MLPPKSVPLLYDLFLSLFWYLSAKSCESHPKVTPYSIPLSCLASLIGIKKKDERRKAPPKLLLGWFGAPLVESSNLYTKHSVSRRIVF